MLVLIVIHSDWLYSHTQTQRKQTTQEWTSIWNNIMLKINIKFVNSFVLIYSYKRILLIELALMIIYFDLRKLRINNLYFEENLYFQKIRKK